MLMQEILSTKALSPADALSVAGKLSFATTTVFGRFGRCMITPFFIRGHTSMCSRNYKITEQITQACNFWLQLLQDKN